MVYFKKIACAGKYHDDQAISDVVSYITRSDKKLRDEYMVCYFAPDLIKFRDTAWGAYNAMSDMITHNAPLRKTENYRENNWGRLMDGHVMMDKMAALLNA